MKYIFDTDPGIDDAIAIMLGYLNKLDIIGFTLATGNISKEKSANNLKTIQDILNSNIPMYYGNKENNKQYSKGKLVTSVRGRHSLLDVPWIRLSSS